MENETRPMGHISDVVLRADIVGDTIKITCEPNTAGALDIKGLGSYQADKTPILVSDNQRSGYIVRAKGGLEVVRSKCPARDKTQFLWEKTPAGVRLAMSWSGAIRHAEYEEFILLQHNNGPNGVHSYQVLQETAKAIKIAVSPGWDYHGNYARSQREKWTHWVPKSQIVEEKSLKLNYVFKPWFRAKIAESKYSLKFFGIMG